jgi:hypothetical protein
MPSTPFENPQVMWRGFVRFRVVTACISAGQREIRTGFDSRQLLRCFA